MRKIFSYVAAAAISGLPGLAQAGDKRPVLVELFTSQACATCPRADAFLHELAAREDVVALALHVDYWDYIYDDLFGKPAHTKRQYGYAAAAGRDMVYTPQMVIGGVEGVVGNRPKDVNDIIERHLEAPRAVSMTISQSNGQITISATADGGFDTPLIVQLARFIPQQTVAIDHGENAGHTYSYVNIVTDLTELGNWDPAQPLALTFEAAEDANIAVILQRPGYGKVEAAALLR
ncbi:DUF1223 domain-containing protein [Roseovarius sp. S4756]|uniref:DUF1223 domain-containing protein n=1 Tax=Roseovarius maritimus TaxID=3342637 RepID=UPI003727FE75